MAYPLGDGAYDMAIGQTTIILCLTNFKPVHRRVVLHRAACHRFIERHLTCPEGLLCWGVLRKVILPKRNQAEGLARI